VSKNELREELVTLLTKSQEEKELPGPLADDVLVLFHKYAHVAIDALQNIRAWGEANVGINPSPRYASNIADKALEALSVPE
jgi:hypothetical protein